LPFLLRGEKEFGQESQSYELVYNHRMIVPGPVIEKGIRKRENQHRQEADFVPYVQVFKN
jgi:hypothetical protein